MLNKLLLKILTFAVVVLLFLLGYMYVKKIGLFTPKKPTLTRIVKSDEVLIIIANNNFSSKSFETDRTKKVIFHNNDDRLHDLTTNYPRFKTQPLAANSEFTFAFLIPGKWTVGLGDNKNAKVEITVKNQ